MRIILPACCLLLALLWGCQKEISFDDPLVNTPQTPTTNDSTLLAKLIYLDTTLAHPNDTTLVYQFTYNSRKKPVEITAYYYESGIKKPGEKIFYTYSGTDTLPSRIVHVYYGFFPTPDTVTSYYNYTSPPHPYPGLVTKDSSIEYVQSFMAIYINVSQYTYVTGVNEVVRTWKNYPVSNPSAAANGYQLFTYTKTGQNIATQKDTSNYDDYFYRYSCTYDNKINPVAAAFNLPYRLISLGGLPGFMINDQQKNNYLTYQGAEYLRLNSSLIDDFRLSMQYQYNVHNLPASVVVTDLNGNYELGNKMVYLYTN
jgi:hypothetical protein